MFAVQNLLNDLLGPPTPVCHTVIAYQGNFCASAIRRRADELNGRFQYPSRVISRGPHEDDLTVLRLRLHVFAVFQHEQLARKVRVSGSTSVVTFFAIGRSYCT